MEDTCALRDDRNIIGVVDVSPVALAMIRWDSSLTECSEHGVMYDVLNKPSAYSLGVVSTDGHSRWTRLLSTKIGISFNMRRCPKVLRRSS